MMDAEGTSSTVIIGGKLVIVGCALVLTAAYVVGVAAGKVIIKVAKASSKSKKKNKSKTKTTTVKKGVGGKGWRGDKTWKSNVKKVSEGGDIKSLNGQVPTEAEAKDLIREAGGKYIRTDKAHKSPNPHNYRHINYLTPSGNKATIKIK